MSLSAETRQHRGFALVFVLFVVVLSTVMAVFFLASTSGERKGTAAYAQGGAALRLADIAVDTVMSQITTATQEGTVSNPVSWASQPGMIRTYKTDGSLSAVYKLYSWSDKGLKESGNAFNPSASSEAPPAGWNESPAVFVDLNQKVNGIYPILDPAVASSGGSVPAYNPTGGGGNLKGVAGFSIDRKAPAVSGSSSGAPMPVKWLYVLQNGELVAPDGGDTAVNVPNASSANPIVGRVAFWTDDESCKVNVNTATEGTYWDWPKTGSVEDGLFACNPPVKNEFSRIPGHPANTSLSAVFQEFRPGYPNDQWGASFSNLLKNIHALSPREGWSESGGGHSGGSVGGTYPAAYTQTLPPAYGFLGTAPLPAPLVVPANRFYATPSELWFQPGTSPGQPRPANDVWAASGLSSPQTLRQREFFLTAASRAPETTLFETPRICLWPITWPNPSSYWDPSRLTASGRVRATGLTAPTAPNPATTLIQNDPWATIEERLLAFCSTLNAGAAFSSQYRYFFQRQDPDSPQNDWTKIPRNQDLVGYLSRLANQNIPGFGGKLADKWGDSYWVPLNCFDYLRSYVNQYTLDGNAQNAAAPGYANYKSGLTYSYTGIGFRQSAINTRVQNIYNEPNAGSVCPLSVTIGGAPYTTGGTYPTLKEAALVFYANDRNEPRPPALPSGAVDTANLGDVSKWQNLIDLSAPGTSTYNTQTTSIRAVMLLDFNGLRSSLPAVSTTPYYSTCPHFWIKVTGSAFGIDGAPAGFPSAAGSAVQCAYPVPTGYNVGFAPCYAPLFYYDNVGNQSAPKIFNPSSTSATAYRTWTLCTKAMTVNSGSPTFNFTGSPVTIQLYACDPTNLQKDTTSDATKLVWTRTVDFSKWNGALGMPLAPRYNSGPLYNTPGGPYAAPATVKAEFVPKVYLPPYAQSVKAMATTPIDTIPNAGTFIYAFQTGTPTGGGSLYYAPNTTATYGDLDDIQESTASTTRRCSTNFRKRVASLTYGSNHQAFFYEGFSPLPATLPTAGAATGELFGGTLGASMAASLITPYDMVISMILDPSQPGAGDPRLTNAPSVSASSQFIKIDSAMNSAGIAGPSPVITDANHPRTTSRAQYHSLGTPGMNLPSMTGYPLIGTAPTLGATSYAALYGISDNGAAIGAMGAPAAGSYPFSLAQIAIGSLLGGEFGPTMQLPVNGDWTSMPGKMGDGGELARIDQDYQTLAKDFSDTGRTMVPYQTKYGMYNVGPAPGVAPIGGSVSTGGFGFNYFSPAREVPSPVVLGTIPSSTATGWQTLVFCPNPAQGVTHPGLQSPRDHLLLDFFWMPVVEPLPLSDQLSTAGKVNLNYQIMPFTYIVRKTALHALMRSTMVTAVPDAASAYYKSWLAMKQSSTTARFPINVDETLKGFDAKFAGGDLFRSASQLCEMYLVPNDGAATWSGMGTYWNQHRMTSDNAREEPYNHLYSRVTTKSNVYTVHWRVQALKPASTAGEGMWDEKRGAILSTLQGSTTIERYIDPNVNPSSTSTLLPDYATLYPSGANLKPLTHYYKWRTVAETYFQP